MHTARLVLVVTALAAWTVTGCGKKPAPQSPTGASQGDAHDHGKDDHSHADDGHGHSHADDVALGTVKIGAWDVKIARGKELAPGKAVHLDIDVSGPAEFPAAIRVWIGTEDAKGALKAKADGKGAEYHADAEAPSSLEGARLWCEVEAADGTRSVGGFDLKQ